MPFADTKTDCQGRNNDGKAAGNGAGNRRGERRRSEAEMVENEGQQGGYQYQTDILDYQDGANVANAAGGEGQHI